MLWPDQCIGAADVRFFLPPSPAPPPAPPVLIANPINDVRFDMTKCAGFEGEKKRKNLALPAIDSASVCMVKYRRRCFFSSRSPLLCRMSTSFLLFSLLFLSRFFALFSLLFSTSNSLQCLIRTGARQRIFARYHACTYCEHNYPSEETHPPPRASSGTYKINLCTVLGKLFSISHLDSYLMCVEYD